MVAPSAIQLVVKSHKTAIFLTTPWSATLPDIKADAFSALLQFASSPETGLPDVSSENDFEICRKEVPSGRAGGTIKYILLDETKTVKQQGLVNWQVLYLRFRDESGDLLDVEVTEPSLEDDEDVEMQPPPNPRGKGKAT